MSAHSLSAPLAWRLPRRAPLAALALVALVSAAPPGAAASEAAAPSLPALQTAIESTLKSAGVPGAAVVVIEGGRVALSIHHGVADLATGRRVRDDTVFRAGSISKTFTAVAALRLAEEGRLSLTASMADLLPEWTHDNPWAHGHPVRLEHLLEHSAGLDDIRYRHYLLDSASMPLSQAVPAFGPYTLRWRPGAGTSYSNAGPVLVGRALERAAGQPFEALMAARVTGPLAMASARWVGSVDLHGRLASSYAADLRTPEPFVDTPGRPSGSLNITAGDLARLPLALLGRGSLEGVRVLSPASVARLESSATGQALPTGGALGWGPGLQAQPQGRALFFGHDGSIDGFVAHMAYAPSLNAGYVVMANALSEAPKSVTLQIRRYLERALPVPPDVGQPVTAAERAAWAGQYQSITPRQELLRAVIGLTQWEGARFEGDVLRYAGQRWFHQGDGVFRAEGAVAPGLRFVQLPSAGWGHGVLAHTLDGTRRRVPGCEATLKLGSLGLAALMLPWSLLMLPLWARAAWLGRLQGSGSTRSALVLRLLPTAALWVAVVVPLGVLMLLGTGDLAWLGRPSVAGWAVAGAGWVAPVVWLVAAWRVWRVPAPPWPRIHALLQLSVAALLLGWLAAHGWLGLRIWA